MAIQDKQLAKMLTCLRKAKAPKTIERIFEISVGKLYGASEQ